jgi:hypothetical protein
VLAGLIANAKDPKAYMISEDAFSKPEPYGIMLRKDDTAFTAIADAATASLYQSPELAALYDKWFTQPIPPKGVNLDIPMSPAMKGPSRSQRIPRIRRPTDRQRPFDVMATATALERIFGMRSNGHRQNAPAGPFVPKVDGVNG